MLIVPVGDEITLDARTYRLYPTNVNGKVILLATEVPESIRVEFRRSLIHRDDRPKLPRTSAAARSLATAPVL